MKTQTEEILWWLKYVGGITPLDAFRDFACFRLGARIYDLRRDGYHIRTEMVTYCNRRGKSVKFAKYFLGGKK